MDENEPGEPPGFRSELTKLLNKFSMERNSDTPDWIMRQFLCDSLRSFDEAVKQRNNWYKNKYPKITKR